MRRRKALSPSSSSSSSGSSGDLSGSESHATGSTSTAASASGSGSNPKQDVRSAAETKEDAGGAAGADGSSVVLRRRGHVKSRLGCFSCKRRRVKCNELRPSCSPCRRLGLTCEYPAAPSQASGTSIGSPALSTPLRSTPSSLTLEDLRFFHQFVTVAFPSLPLKRPDIWSRVAGISHEYDYLAHAMLGLGASHISQNCGIDYSSQALQHRVIAIRQFSQELGKPIKSPSDEDALFATIICLASQSSLMDDSMVDYLTMARGGALIVGSVLTNNERSIFGDFTTDSHVQSLSTIVRDLPKDLEVIDGFVASVLQLKPLCDTPAELRYWDSLYTPSVALRTSSLDAWKGFVILYMMPGFFSHEEFAAFIKLDNYCGQLLAIHMFLLDYLCGTYCIAPTDEPQTPGRKNMVISWVKKLVDTLPADFQKYIEWPRQYCEVLAQRDSRYLLSP